MWSFFASTPVVGNRTHRSRIWRPARQPWTCTDSAGGAFPLHGRARRLSWPEPRYLSPGSPDGAVGRCLLGPFRSETRRGGWPNASRTRCGELHEGAGATTGVGAWTHHPRVGSASGACATRPRVFVSSPSSRPCPCPSYTPCPPPGVGLPVTCRNLLQRVPEHKTDGCPNIGQSQTSAPTAALPRPRARRRGGGCRLCRYSPAWPPKLRSAQKPASNTKRRSDANGKRTDCNKHRPHPSPFGVCSPQ